ncbi:MAG: hypothetical protein RL660_1190 [Bacteroidota bacterium]
MQFYYRASIYCLMLSLFAVAAQAQVKNFIDQPYIEVIGTADTQIVPDEIYVQIILDEQDSRDRIPVEQQEVKLVNIVRNLGMQERDLKLKDAITRYRFGFSIFGKDHIRKSKQYELLLHDAQTLSKLMIACEEAKIGNARVDRTTHSKLNDILDMLRQGAAANAKQQATATAKTIGQNIGSVIYAKELVPVTTAAGEVEAYEDKAEVFQVKKKALYKGSEGGASSYNSEIVYNELQITAAMQLRIVLKP